MLNRTKLKISAAGTALIVTFSVVSNIATAGAAPAQPERHPTPGPVKPHSLQVAPSTWSIPGPHRVGMVHRPLGLAQEPDGIGWPETNTWSIP